MNPNNALVQRTLVDPNRTVNGGTVGYNLYTNLLRTQVWGDGGAAFTNAGLARTGTGVNETIPVYAKLFLSGLQLTGNYTDRVTVTLTY